MEAHKGPSWRLHGVLLGCLALGGLLLYAWEKQLQGGLIDLRGVLTMLYVMVALGYAVLSSIVVAAIGSRTGTLAAHVVTVFVCVLTLGTWVLLK